MYREISPGLERLYRSVCETPSDINEHLPLLRELARECEHVTEFGVRDGNSTIALLAGQPSKLVSWDVDPRAIVCSRSAEVFNILIGEEPNRTIWEPRVGSTLEIRTEPTDMLFIDTFHTGAQLWAELKRHVDPVEMPVKKFLVFHDTETFGMVGEDGVSPALRGAIRHFQKNWAFPQWEVLHDFKHNNGLVVLKAVTP